MADDSVADIEIPIWVRGTQKWVTGLTKRTTCDDVIYALHYQDGMHEHVNTSAYAIFEKWREVERPLQGRTKIVKVWRTWGADQCNVHLSMKKLDELEFSGEFSLTRRRKRSRRKHERDREREKERRSRDHRNHHGYCQNTSERLRSMETLVKLVISQERKLKDMIEHGDDTEKLIDKYESRLHKHRLKCNGEEYAKDMYFDENVDEMDEMFSNANIEELETYVSYCDKVIAIEDKIQSEHAKIEDLAYQIQMCSNTQETCESMTVADDISVVQVEITRAKSCSIMQQYKYQDLQRELQFYEDKLAYKDDLCRRLEQQLAELDSLARSSESLDAAGDQRSPRDNPLPVPERAARAQHVFNPSTPPPPLPERTRPQTTHNHVHVANPHPPTSKPPMNSDRPNIKCQGEPVIERKPILKASIPEHRNGYNTQCRTNVTGETVTKVRFKTDDLIDKYNWEESSLSEGISMDHSDISDQGDYGGRRFEYGHIKSGAPDRPYLTVKVEDPDSNSDTGLSSMHSDDSAVYHLETLV